MSTFEAKMSTFDDSDFGNVDSSSKESTFPRADPPWHFDQKSTMRTEVYKLKKCQENVNVMSTLGTQVSGSANESSLNILSLPGTTTGRWPNIIETYLASQICLAIIKLTLS
jgi:hypothetical protein